MNNFTQLVRLGKDAEVKMFDGDKSVTSFSAAFEYRGKDKQKHTMWLDCSAWGKRFVKVTEYMKKGALVLVQGALGQREHDGKVYMTLDVRELQLCGKKES